MLVEQRERGEGVSRPAGSGSDGVLGRALKNAAWLLGGKGIGGLLSLVYLALLARTLGVGLFGVFAMMTAYAQSVASVVSFQSWQTVIRYGAQHLAEDRAERLGQVLGFTTMLDLAAAFAAAVLAALGVAALGPSFGWTIAQQWTAALFCASLLVGQRGTPIGILRLFDRFDLAAYGELMVPVVRLVGVGTAWALGGTLGGFLLAWAAAELVTTIVMWLLALRELRARHTPLPRRALHDLTVQNPGIWRFSITTNFGASLQLVWQQFPVLAVGWIAGAPAAGGFRVASQLGVALTKPVISLARAVYPEMAKLTASAGAAALSPVLQRTAMLAAIVGVLSVVVVAFAGPEMLRLIGGPEFVFAQPIMLVLTIGSAINLVGFGLEPALIASGKPGTALIARGIASAIYVVAIIVLVHLHGPIGGAWAALIATLCSTVLLHIAFRRALRDGCAPAQEARLTKVTKL